MSRRTTERERSPAESSGRIKLRIKRADKVLVGRAAAVQGKTRSGFMLEVWRRAAEEALLASTLLRVDPETYARFLELLDQPPQPNKALRQLLQPKAPWEG